MGFYSIFRTIRLIIKDIFGRKVWRFILIVAIVLILYLFLTNKTFAYTSPDTSQTNGTSFSSYLPEQLAYYYEDIYQAQLISLIQQYGNTYNDVFETGNTLGYIDYLLKNCPGIQIFCAPSSYNNTFGTYVPSGTRNLTVVLYYYQNSSVTYPSTKYASTWMDIENLTLTGMYGNSNLPSSAEAYQNLSSSVQIVKYYTFLVTDGSLYASGVIDDVNNCAVVPLCLINYKSDLLYEYLQNDDSTNTDIINAIDSSTEEITSAQQETTQAINTLTDNFFSDETDDDSLTTSLTDTSSSVSTDVDSDGIGVITAIISTLLEKITSDDYNTVTQIEIPLINDNSIVIRSDVVSAHINDTLTNLISVFWYAVFGIYLLRFILKVSHQIATLEFVKNGSIGTQNVITDTLF